MVSGGLGGGGRRKRWIGGGQGIFQDVETMPYDSVMVDTWHYAFGKTHTTLEHRVNPKVNGG